MLMPLLLMLQASDTAAYSAAECRSCAEWNAPSPPRRLFGNTWYVGTRGLASVLITSDSGHILLDGGLPSSAPLIAANIRALGFLVEDVRLMANSHAHSDHAGGLAALQRMSGAEVVALDWSARVIRDGRSPSDDPQFGILLDYPPVARVRVIADGEELRVGPLRLTAHATPGHTPGGTSWSWRSCEGDRCLDFVYGDSQSAVSAEGFSFARSGAAAQFERGFAALERLRCDVLVTPHPSASRLAERLEAGTLEDPEACRRYAAASRARLAARLQNERAP
jgi:metallo-beta-lactamase class B